MFTLKCPQDSQRDPGSRQGGYTILELERRPGLEKLTCGQRSREKIEPENQIKSLLGMLDRGEGF